MSDQEALKNPYNRYFALDGCLSPSCGIPADKPLWSVRNPDLGVIGLDWTIDGQGVYVRGRKADKTLCVDLQTGEQRWLVDGLSNRASRGVGIIEDLAVLGCYAQDRATGAVFADLRHPDLVGPALTHTPQYVPFRFGTIATRADPEPEKIYVNLREGTMTPLGFGFLGRLTPDGRYYVGWDGCELVGWDLEQGERRWAYPLPADDTGAPMAVAPFRVADGCVYLHAHVRDIICLSLETGETLWTIDGPKIPAGNSRFSAEMVNQINVGGGVLLLSRYVGQQDPLWRIQCRALSDRRLLWERPDGVDVVPEIAGDLVLLRHDDGLLSACDLYTGETLWTMPKRMSALASYKVVDDKLVVTSTVGEMRCYRFSQHYHSRVSL